MKKYYFILLFALSSVIGTAQITFSITTGYNLYNAYSIKTANFGYSLGKINPYISLQYIGVSGSYYVEGKHYVDSLGSIVDYTENQSGRASVLLTTLGAKYFLLEKETVKMYSTLSFSVPFVSVMLKEDDNPIEDMDEIKKDVKNAKFFIAEVGVGGEYYLSDQFSIGGEFGFRHFNYGFNTTNTVNVYNNMTGESVETERYYEYKARLSPSYTKLSMNFYF